MDNIEHPDITSAGRTGYPCGVVPVIPRCPVCGEECDTLYSDRDGYVFGCDECVNRKCAWET